MSDVLIYARQANHPLFVTVSLPNETKEFKLSLKRYRQMIKNYCIWYNAVTVLHTYNDFEDNVRLSNGITFTAMLY